MLWIEAIKDKLIAKNSFIFKTFNSKGQNVSYELIANRKICNNGNTSIYTLMNPVGQFKKAINIKRLMMVFELKGRVGCRFLEYWCSFNRRCISNSKT